MGKIPSCFDCKSEAPKTESGYTLISSGWRLVRRHEIDGEFSFEWRCPRCWTKYKVLHGVSSTGSMPRVMTPPRDSAPQSTEDPHPTAPPDSLARTSNPSARHATRPESPRAKNASPHAEDGAVAETRPKPSARAKALGRDSGARVPAIDEVTADLSADARRER